MNYKVKENIILITIVSMILVAIVGLFILINTEEDLIPNQWILELSLIIISFLIFLIPIFIDKRNLNTKDSTVEEPEKNLGNKTSRIKVDLSKCKLECNSSYERVESNNPAEISNHWEGLKPSKNVITNVKKSE